MNATASQVQVQEKCELPDHDVGASSLAEAARILFLTSDNAVFHQTDGGMLAVSANGQYHPCVYVHCSFPHTNRTRYLSIRNPDNLEIGMVRSLDDVDASTGKLLESQIQMRYFAPAITRLLSVKEEFGYSYWEAETNSGICRFTVRGGGGQVKTVASTRLLITDVDGNRFVVPDYTALSEKEFRMIEMFM